MSQPPYGPPPNLTKTPSGAPQQPYGAPQQPYGAPQQPPAQKPFYQRTWFGVLALVLVVGTIGSALGDDDESPSTAASASSSAASSSAAQEPTVAPTPSVAAVAPPATTAAPVPPTTEAAPTATFAMPDLVGLDLQTAQDLVQTNGVFLSVSHDLLGSRNQVVDSNWVVCTQNIPVGQQVSTDAEGEIDLGVVKREERCP